MKCGTVPNADAGNKGSSTPRMSGGQHMVLHADPLMYRIALRISGGAAQQLKFYSDLFRVNYRVVGLYMKEWPVIDNKHADLFAIFAMFIRHGGFFKVFRHGSAAQQVLQKKDAYAQTYIKYLLVFEWLYTHDNTVNTRLVTFVQAFVCQENAVPKLAPAQYYVMDSGIVPPLNGALAPLPGDGEAPLTGRPLLRFRQGDPGWQLAAAVDYGAVRRIDRLLGKYRQRPLAKYLGRVLDELRGAAPPTVFRTRLLETAAAGVGALLQRPIAPGSEESQTFPLLVLVLARLNEMNAQACGVRGRHVVYPYAGLEIDTYQLSDALSGSVTQIYVKMRFLGSLLMGGGLLAHYRLIKQLSSRDHAFNDHIYATIVSCPDRQVVFAAVTLLRAQLLVLEDEHEGINANALSIAQHVVNSENVRGDIRGHVSGFLDELRETDLFVGV